MFRTLLVSLAVVLLPACGSKPDDSGDPVSTGTTTVPGTGTTATGSATTSTGTAVTTSTGTAEPALSCSDGAGEVLRYYDLAGSLVNATASAASWAIISSPPGWSATVEMDQLGLRFFPDIVGQYVFRLTVDTEGGDTLQCESTFDVTTTDILRVELSWNPGASFDASDLDLYLLQNPPGGQLGYYYRDATGVRAGPANPDACHWRNCASCDVPYSDPDREQRCRDFAAQPPTAYPGEPWPASVLAWGPLGSADDPRLELDDIEGQGPELIAVQAPATGVYRVAVHYFDPDGFGDSEAWVRVLCGGVVVYASEGVTLTGSDAAAGHWTSDLWEVGELDVNGTSCHFTEFGSTGCHRICPLQDSDGGCAPAACE